MKERTEAIKAVTAKYGYTPEFLGIYAQVGAVYSSYKQNIVNIIDKSREEILKAKKTTNDIIYLDNEVSRKMTSLNQKAGVSLTWLSQKTNRISPKYSEDKILSMK